MRISAFSNFSIGGTPIALTAAASLMLVWALKLRALPMEHFKLII